MSEYEPNPDLENEMERGVFIRLPKGTLAALKAVSIVDGQSVKTHVQLAITAHLDSLVLEPGFAGEFRDACLGFDERQAILTGSEQVDVTHGELAPGVMGFRQQARERLSS